jgi:hypothetical protein
MKIEVKTEDNLSTSSVAEDQYIKCVATHNSAGFGKQARQTIDELGLVLLLVNVYGQQIIGADRDSYRGEVFTFEDNPIVRTCIGLWQQSYKENDILSPIERFLFSMLDYGTVDIFIDQEHRADEIKQHIKELKDKYGIHETRK